ncbi:hypothetical protein AMATHDRAFT_47011 [Amanita thiersii Skay4041]|uniref:Uncharacterized protein n=1 Tax=Amanita thiersii Skay4041 TaxID=703135 RepID=A0A2A9NT62_9AGAR|nr:hypothetical protein AMATHDRAFT_47011 [Amanita thiersii Skay4041]
MDTDSEQEAESNLLPSYLTDFQKHLAHVKAHTLGGASTPQLPSFVRPASYWCASEKNAFFHALSRFSRLRPDLIAAHIQTKSTADVCAYIDNLEAASKTTKICWSRRDLGIAFDVSDSWIDVEEKNAIYLNTLERRWKNRNHEASREAEISKKRMELGHAYAFSQWKEERESQWAKEDALRYLDIVGLTTLESTLREGDYELSQTADETTECKATNHQEFQTLNEVSDPSTLRPVDIDLPCPLKVGNTPADFASEPSSSRTVISQEISPPPHSPPQLPSAANTTSPTTRRRLRKRLYMRRKRAEMMGVDVNYTSNRLRPGRERKQRTSKPRPKTYMTKNRQVGAALGTENNSASVSNEDTPDYQSADPITNLRNDNIKVTKKGGTTKPYKMRHYYQEKHITLADIKKAGLGLFHLSTFSRLIELYSTGYAQDISNELDSISSETIRLLSSITVEFITEVIHRAIVLKIQELSSKGGIKAWRLGQKEISADIIQCCLNMMGFQGLNKEAYFGHLAKENPASDEKSDEGEYEDDELADHSIVLAHAANILPMAATYLYDPSPTLTDTDDEGLQKELDEEEDTDRSDFLMIKQYEDNLWQEILR